MTEKYIETKLREGISRRKGIAIKLLSYITGLPDRLVLLPMARIWFVETKSSSGVLKPRQTVMKNLIERLGFQWRLVNSPETLHEFFKEVDQ